MPPHREAHHGLASHTRRVDDVELRKGRVAAQREREGRDLLHAQLHQRHVRERAVAAQAAGEQPEGLDLLELGLGEIELTVAATRGQAW